MNVPVHPNPVRLKLAKLLRVPSIKLAAPVALPTQTPVEEPDATKLVYVPFIHGDF